MTGLATALGSLPFLFVRELSRRAYDLLLGLGAGLMLAAATLGLLAEAIAEVKGPSGLHTGLLAMVATGFIAGIVVGSLMDRLIPHRHASGHHQHIGHEPGHDRHDHAVELRRGYAMVGALTIHRIPEGIAIGAGFAAGGHAAKLGVLLAIAVGIQNACEGVVMAAPLRQGGAHPMRGVLVAALVGLTTPIAAVVGNLLAAGAVRSMPFILALAAGTLIYVTSNEIIPESHSHGHEGTATSGLAAGFVITMILQAILH